jgi:hypothetical protein
MTKPEIDLQASADTGNESKSANVNSESAVCWVEDYAASGAFKDGEGDL